VSSVAVVAHALKTMGSAGLVELRRALEAEGIDEPLWFEVSKAKRADRCGKEALDEGAEVLFAWGGDGLVRRCINVVAGSSTKRAILPAGTANLLATNLGIPRDLEPAVHTGIHGQVRKLDVGTVNGECFAVMAGGGFDARMIGDADDGLKERIGRLSYVWTGTTNLRSKPFKATISVDGSRWFSGNTSCLLVGNVGSLFGGLEVFSDARPDDGLLELGVVTADGLVQWLRTIARTAVGTPDDSPFVQTTKAHTVKAKLSRKIVYELDGGARGKTKTLKVGIRPAAVAVCVPYPD
jgi:YegS/Rv2252/BmrU family lipid kinase